MPRADLRARIGHVEQNAPVLAGRIRDNLLLTAPAAIDTHEELLGTSEFYRELARHHLLV